MTKRKKQSIVSRLEEIKAKQEMLLDTKGIIPQEPKTLKEWTIAELSIGAFFLLASIFIYMLLNDFWIIQILLGELCLLSYAFWHFLLVLHEGGHYYTAKSLGYPSRFETTKKGKITKHSIVIDPEDIGITNDSPKWQQDRVKIRMAPYNYTLPVSLVGMVIGSILFGKEIVYSQPNFGLGILVGCFAVFTREIVNRRLERAL